MNAVFKRVALAVMLGAFSAGSAVAAVTGRVGHAMPEDHPQAKAMNKFVELAGKYTNNNVQLKAFHSATLGSDEKMLQAVQSGTQEFFIGTLAPFSARRSMPRRPSPSSASSRACSPPRVRATAAS